MKFHLKHVMCIMLISPNNSLRMHCYYLCIIKLIIYAKSLTKKNEIIKSLLLRNTVSTNEVDFLRNELNEKNFLLRTITIKDSHVYAGVYNEKPDEM